MLRRRLEKLEGAARKAGRGRPCPGCGDVLGFEPAVHIIPAPAVKTLAEGLALEKSQDTSKDLCAVCAQRMIFRIPLPKVARLAHLPM